MNEEQRQLMFRGIAHDTDRMDGIIRLLVDAARIVGGHLDLLELQSDDVRRPLVVEGDRFKGGQRPDRLVRRGPP